jgi:hypothetical protein
MSSSTLMVILPLAALYGAFLLWYGGRGKPMSRDELERLLAPLRERAQDHTGQSHLADIERIVARDDGCEFVLHNAIRYRTKALYPPGHDYGDSATAADRRYQRAVVPYLLRYGNLPLFVARRSGEFVEPHGIDRWDVVAMVRYRSLRDFLRFANAVTQDRITVHKWAAIENTQIFPVKPFMSLIFVRASVGVLLAAIGLLLVW